MEASADGTPNDNPTQSNGIVQSYILLCSAQHFRQMNDQGIQIKALPYILHICMVMKLKAATLP